MSKTYINYDMKKKYFYQQAFITLKKSRYVCCSQSLFEDLTLDSHKKYQCTTQLS
jgi:hypothetical protein